MEILSLEKAKSASLSKEKIVETFMELQKIAPKTFVEGRQLHEALKKKYPEEFGKISSQRRSTEIRNALTTTPGIWFRKGGDYFYVTEELLEEAKKEGVSKEDIEAELKEAGFKLVGSHQ